MADMGEGGGGHEEKGGKFWKDMSTFLKLINPPLSMRLQTLS